MIFQDAPECRSDFYHKVTLRQRHHTRHTEVDDGAHAQITASASMRYQ
jgi:hypothetical protein